MSKTITAVTLVCLILAAIAAPAAAGAAGIPEIPAKPEGFVPPYAANEEIATIGRDVGRLWSFPTQRVEAIIQRIFWERDGLGFTYRAHPTLTAVEAYAQHEGNCLSLVNLFVAMARSAGLRAFFVDVEDFEAFYRYGETVVRSTHVVGGVMIDGALRTVDFLPERDKRYRRLSPIDDARATAHYFNAIAAKAMLDGDLVRAEGLFKQALAFDAGFSDPWNNYAVLLRRSGRLDDGIEVLEKALALDRHFLPAIENLATYYRLAGKAELAGRMDARALDEKTKNPYFVYQQALNRFQEGKPAEAEQLLHRARRLDSKFPEVYLLLGRIELDRGERSKAESHFAKAKKLGAEHFDAFQRGLDAKIRQLLVVSEG